MNHLDVPTNVMTSSIFAIFIFAEAAKNAKICTMVAVTSSARNGGHESHAAAMGSCKACNFLAVTVAVFLILSAVWMWTHHPRLNLPPRSPLPAYPGTSEHKELQGEWGLPLSLPGIRTYEKKIKSKPVERNQLLSSITSYTKLNISFERIKIDSSSSSVFISLRTTVAFHKSRLLLLLLTWLQTVNPKQVCKLSSSLVTECVVQVTNLRSCILLIMLVSLCHMEQTLFIIQLAGQVIITSVTCPACIPI